MRISTSSRLLLATFVALAHAASTFGETTATESTRVAQVPAMAEAPRRFKFLLFWNQDNAQVRQMSETLRRSAEKRADRVEWSAIDVKDPANRETVDRYQLSRAPLPLALCVAPNGAVTGAFVRQINDVAVERALITPAMAEATKALQEQKIVIVHVKPAADVALPQGTAEFMSDPAFKARTTVVDVVIGDPVESRFVADMKINPSEVTSSMLVVMAPPAVLVGKFPADVTGQQLGAAVHAAGKCCNDPNCKHNQKAQQQ